MTDVYQYIYLPLLRAHGRQGWWPLLSYAGTDPAASGRLTGYHPGNYDFPRSQAEQFEICTGAILTQNTSWKNVEKALPPLEQNRVLNPRSMLAMEPGRLAELIRPAGYFNIKARKLQEFSRFYLKLQGRTPTREELLAVWGVGAETADSILLYAYRRVEMVVDAYTRRLLLKRGLISDKAGYQEIKQFCQRGLPRHLDVYQEFHALIVEEGKKTRN